jgi:hypothetical protein
MKNTGSRALLCLLFISQVAFAQEVNVRIIEGFKNGDPALIADYLAPMVDYMGPKKEEQLTANQTRSELSSFFYSNKVSSFVVKHTGKSPSGNGYLIGVLTSNKGTHRIYLLFPGKSKEKISEIRIEKDE